MHQAGCLFIKQYNKTEIVKALMYHSADDDFKESVEIVPSHKQNNIFNKTECDFNMKNK